MLHKQNKIDNQLIRLDFKRNRLSMCIIISFFLLFLPHVLLILEFSAALEGWAPYVIFLVCLALSVYKICLQI